jgi:hypothetical protein
MDPANTNYAHSQPEYHTPLPSFYHSAPHSAPHLDDYTFVDSFFDLARDNIQVPTPKVSFHIVVDFFDLLTIIVALAFSFAISGKPNIDIGCSLDFLPRRHSPPVLVHFYGVSPKYSPDT